MHKIELNINGLYGYKLTCFKPSKQFEKRVLTGNDWLTLRGALAELASANELDAVAALNAAAIQDDELYLNDFEGYQLSERLNLRTLYLTSSNQVIASVYDKKKDRHIDFITW